MNFFAFFHERYSEQFDANILVFRNKTTQRKYLFLFDSTFARICKLMTRTDSIVFVTRLQLEKILDDSDSKGLWLHSTRDTTNMTRPRHWHKCRFLGSQCNFACDVNTVTDHDWSNLSIIIAAQRKLR